MTISIVPTFDDPSYTQTVSLEGTSYILQFDYNQRAAAWYLSIADASNVDIYNGVKLTCNLPLLKRCKDPRKPAGELFTVTATSDASPPSLEDLLPGARCTLVYISSDWVAQIRAGAFTALFAQLAAHAQSTELSPYGTE